MGGPARSAEVKRIHRCGFVQEFQTDTICRKHSERNRPSLHRWYVAVEKSGVMIIRVELRIRHNTYLDAVRFVKDKPVVVNGMNDTFAQSQQKLCELDYRHLLSSLTVPLPRVHPFSCLRCIDSKLESIPPVSSMVLDR